VTKWPRPPQVGCPDYSSSRPGSQRLLHSQSGGLGELLLAFSLLSVMPRGDPFRAPEATGCGDLRAGGQFVPLALGREGKAARTVRTYTEAVWFAAAHLLGQVNRGHWGEVGKRDVQEWVAWLLGRYSAAYASNQFRALQQFFEWPARRRSRTPWPGRGRPGSPTSRCRCSPATNSGGWSGRAPAPLRGAPRRRGRFAVLAGPGARWRSGGFWQGAEARTLVRGLGWLLARPRFEG
jgi:hypothetical protein